MREAAKSVARALATILVSPCLASFHVKRLFIGRDRALEGSSQFLALLPGLVGVYLRGAFLARVLDDFHTSAAVHFGTIFSQAGARIGARVYVGPRCHLGLVHIECDALLAAGVHIPSGAHTHGTDRTDAPIRDQASNRTTVRVGEGAWIGSAAIVLADVGRHSVVAAGAVVTRALGDFVVAAGVPAKTIKSRIPEPPPHDTAG